MGDCCCHHISGRRSFVPLDAREAERSTRDGRPAGSRPCHGDDGAGRRPATPGNHNRAAVIGDPEGVTPPDTQVTAGSPPPRRASSDWAPLEITRGARFRRSAGSARSEGEGVSAFKHVGREAHGLQRVAALLARRSRPSRGLGRQTAEKHLGDGGRGTPAVVAHEPLSGSSPRWAAGRARIPVPARCADGPDRRGRSRAASRLRAKRGRSRRKAGESAPGQPIVEAGSPLAADLPEGHAVETGPIGAVAAGSVHAPTITVGGSLQVRCQPSSMKGRRWPCASALWPMAVVTSARFSPPWSIR